MRELAGLPLSFGNKTDVATCGALGYADDGVQYDYSGTVWVLPDKSVYVTAVKIPWEKYRKDKKPYQSRYIMCAIDLVAGRQLPCRR